MTEPLQPAWDHRPARRRSLGIRASLLLAFFAISGFVVLASATALYGLLRVSLVLEDITDRRTPAMVSSLDLSRQVERFVAAAQRLSIVETRDDYRLISAQLDIRPILAALEAVHSENTQALHDIVSRFGGTIARLDAVVADRLAVSEQKAQSLRDLLNSDMAFQYAARPLHRAAYSDAIGLETALRQHAGSTSLAAITPSIGEMVSLNRLGRIEIAFARAHDLLLIGATANSESDLQLTILSVTRALTELDQATGDAPPHLETVLDQAAKLRPQLEAPSGVLPLRKRELDDRLAADTIVGQTRTISRELIAAVDTLVKDDSERVVQGAAEAAAVRRISVIRLLVVIAGSLGCSALIVWLYVNRRIVARLALVRDSMLALAEGRLSNELPPRGDDEIGRMAAALRIFRQTAIERDERELAQARAEEQLKRTLSDVANLLDNSGEGFLSFGADLIVDRQCSRACEELLGMAPAGQDAGDVLFGGDPVKCDLLRDVATAAIKEADSIRRDILLSLLPGEVSHAGRTLEASYKVLDNGHLMVVLTDVTERQRLAATLTNEHRQFSMVVAAVTESREFFDAIESFRDFIDRDLPQALLAPPGLHRVQDVYRDIHTYKGVLGQFSLSHTPKALHAIEERLADLAEEQTPPSRQEISRAIGISALREALEADLDSLRGILGDAFVTAGARTVLTAGQMAELRHLAARLSSRAAVDADAAGLGDALRKILDIGGLPLRDVMIGYDRLLSDTAARLGKRLAPIAVHGGEDVTIDPERYGPFLRSLVHVFRNAVAHGIEDPDIRLASGKEREGRISVTIARDGKAMRLTIGDDGAGIDTSLLRHKAVSAGLYSATAIADLCHDDVIDLIFRDGISTREMADDLAGRGVGLAAVRAETQKLGGRVKVLSVSGQGTQFLFELPWAVSGDTESADSRPAVLVDETMPG